MDKVSQNWGHFLSWKGGSRRLVVIDEALDIIQESQIDLEKVKLIRALIPEEVAMKHSDQHIPSRPTSSHRRTSAWALAESSRSTPRSPRHPSRLGGPPM
jgi:hypothetical protein